MKRSKQLTSHQAQYWDKFNVLAGLPLSYLYYKSAANICLNLEPHARMQIQ